MSSTGSIIKAVQSAASALPRAKPGVRKKPSPLPLRSLEPDKFKPPRGRKQVFLPNFVLTFIRPPPHQPAHYASFLTPIWMNKLDLKDYLYNLYAVETLHVRSYIIHGKVGRDARTNRLFRKSQKKKMTIEMKPGDNFVWPDAPADLAPWDKSLLDATRKEKEGLREGFSEQGQRLGEVPGGEKKSVREQARALLEGKARWRPSWEVNGTGTAPLRAGEARPTATA